MNKRYLYFLIAASLFFGCNFSSIVDTNQSVEGNKWLYTNATKAEFEISDTTSTYNADFKLRISSDYRYANLFVVTTFRDSTRLKKIRYQFKLVKADGQWLGKGSGDLYTYILPILKKHNFPRAGKYSIEIEQNMRENPLLGVSDVGIVVTKN